MTTPLLIDPPPLTEGHSPLPWGVTKDRDELSIVDADGDTIANMTSMFDQRAGLSAADAGLIVRAVNECGRNSVGRAGSFFTQHLVAVIETEREAIAETLQRMADAADMAGGLASPKQHRLHEAVAAVRARGPKASKKTTATSPSQASPVTETPSEASPFTGHTPGPWLWEISEHYDEAHDGYVVHTHQTGEITSVIAFVDTSDNARLIAAAPSLLAERDALKVDVERFKRSYQVVEKELKEAEKERDALREELAQEKAEYDNVSRQLDEAFKRINEEIRASYEVRKERDAAQSEGRRMCQALMTERDEARAEVARLTETLERQKGALRQFEVANRTIAMARAPAELKEAAAAARRNEAGVQEANAVLTEEVERLTEFVDGRVKHNTTLRERNAGLAAALREIRALRWPPGCAGHVADMDAMIDQTLEQWGGAE